MGTPSPVNDEAARPSSCVANWRAAVPDQNTDRVNPSDAAEHLTPRHRVANALSPRNWVTVPCRAHISEAEGWGAFEIRHGVLPPHTVATGGVVN